MNPPFHERGFESEALGISMIKAAAGALKSGGKLIFVANRQLPYEADLRRLFVEWRELDDKQGFKIILAQK
jgi:16S rRNA (guanine1207-N2)-methyltransferase